MEIARGGIGDRPWGATLFAAARANISCHVCVVSSSGTTHEIEFEGDAIVGAKSSLTADSAVRIALAQRFISAAHVDAITERLACDITRDEIDVIAEQARLDPSLVAKLRQRVVAQRAARTFAIEDGTFTIHQVPPDGTRFVAVDARWIIYNGVLSYCSEGRLSKDLEVCGSRFTLRPHAIDSISQFGFDATDRPILEALHAGTTLSDLEAAHPELEPRAVHSVIYALVVCGACDAEHRADDPMPQRNVRSARADTEPCAFDPELLSIPLRKTPPPTPIRTGSGTLPPPTSQFTRPFTQRLGRGSQPPPTQGNPMPLVAPAPRPPGELAAEAFRRGLAFLNEDRIERAIDELSTAVELAPDDPDHHAMLAWARFCGADDRLEAAVHVRKALARAIQKSVQPTMARFYLGRVERMLGRDREALQHFQIVLDEHPRHVDALAEVRALAARRRS